MEVILHIGLPKTGSSSIQNWGVRVSKELEQIGIHFLPSVMAGHRIAAEFVSDSRRALDDDVLAIKAAISLEQVERNLIDLAARPELKAIIISSEYFYISNQFLVSSYFKGLGLNVSKIIAYVRRQDHLLASGYNQDIKALKRFRTFEVTGYEEAYDYYALAQTWQRAFPAAYIQLHNFDRLAKLDQVVSSLARAIGADDLSSSGNCSSIHINDSLCAEMLEIVRVANSLGLHEVASLAIDPNILGIKGSKFAFNEDLVTTILKLYQSSNEKLIAAFGEEFDDFCKASSQAEGIDLTGKFPAEHAVRLLNLAARHFPHA